MMSGTVPATAPITVVVVDDHDELRASLRRMLERRDIVVVGEASDQDEALAIVAIELPDAVLVDVNLAGSAGSNTTRSIKERFPNTRVVAWSGEEAGEMDMLRAGADAFVLKGEPTDRLVEALRVGPVNS